MRRTTAPILSSLSRKGPTTPIPQDMIEKIATDAYGCGRRSRSARLALFGNLGKYSVPNRKHVLRVTMQLIDFIGARGRTRTGTAQSRGILSPLRLPVSPPGLVRNLNKWPIQWMIMKSEPIKADTPSDSFLQPSFSQKLKIRISSETIYTLALISSREPPNQSKRADRKRSALLLLIHPSRNVLAFANEFYKWRPQGDSNPCYRRERAVSWASRRWGRL